MLFWSCARTCAGWIMPKNLNLGLPTGASGPPPPPSGGLIALPTMRAAPVAAPRPPPAAPAVAVPNFTAMLAAGAASSRKPFTFAPEDPPAVAPDTSACVFPPPENLAISFAGELRGVALCPKLQD